MKEEELEERIRQLEAEQKKIKGVIDQWAVPETVRFSDGEPVPIPLEDRVSLFGLMYGKLIGERNGLAIEVRRLKDEMLALVDKDVWGWTK